MSYLLDQVPEATVFFNEVIEDIAQYRLFPEERFENYLTGIIATTEVDSQGDQLTPEAISKMAEQLNGRLIWNQAEHDPLIQPIGRSIAARVFYAPESDVYFVAGVSGTYDIAYLPKFADLGIDMDNLAVSASGTGDYQAGAVQAQLAVGPADLDQATVDALLIEHPRLLSALPSDRTRKAADPLSIIEFAVSTWLLTSNPFSQAFLSKFGEKAAEQVIEFFGWIKGKVVQAVQQHHSKRVLLEFVSEHRGCKVVFVIDSKEPEVLLPAIDSLESAARSAFALVDRLVELEPNELVYGFDRKTGQWLPLHAATRKRGVIVDRPVLIALDRYRSFSIGGSVTQRRLEDKSDPSPQ